MADKRITELSAIGAIDIFDDLLPIVSNADGVTKKTTVFNFYDNLIPVLSLDFLPTIGGTLNGSLIIGSAGTITVSGGSSDEWNSVYNSYSANSAAFLTNETDSQTLSFNENTTELSILSGNTVSLSAIAAAAQDIPVRALTGNWQNTYTDFTSQSADYSSVYSTVQSNSASWNVDVDTGVRELTSNWQDTYTIVNANSAAWDNVSFNDNITYAEGLSAFDQCLRITIEGKVRYLRLFDIGLELFEFATEDLIDVVGTEDDSSVIFFT